MHIQYYYIFGHEAMHQILVLQQLQFEHEQWHLERIQVWNQSMFQYVVYLNTLCFEDSETGGGGLLCPCFQASRAFSTVVLVTACNLAGSSCWTRVDAPAAEAKKAECASIAALLKPRPPNFTGRDAWDQA